MTRISKAPTAGKSDRGRKTGSIEDNTIQEPSYGKNGEDSRKEQKPMKRYQPKKQTNPAKAHREKCIECMGGRGSGQNYTKLIKECPDLVCPSYIFRFGKDPNRKQNLTDEQRKERANRFKRKRK
jgi:hypothetical protein